MVPDVLDDRPLDSGQLFGGIDASQAEVIAFADIGNDRRVAHIEPQPFAQYAAAGRFENSGVKKCIAAAQPVFDLLGAKDQLVAEYPDCGHDFPDDVRERVYGWLAKQLKAGRGE